MPSPYDDNPYLAGMMQPAERPHWTQTLGQLLSNVGAGIGMASASGRPWGAGIAPGVAMASQAMQGDEDRRFRQGMATYQAQQAAAYRKAQMDAMQGKADAEKQRMALGGQLASAFGFNVQPDPVRMGPQVAQGDDPASAIAGIESNGRYDAVGPVANPAGNRAYGKFQIMDFNVGPWTQEILGKPMTPQEFLANPQAQDAVFKGKWAQYRQQYGSDEAASRAWFAGPGGMNNQNAKDVLGTTVADYSRKFQQGMSPQIAQGDSTLGPGVTNGPPPSFVAQLPPEIKAAIGTAYARGDIEGGNKLLIDAYKNTQKVDAWTPLTPGDVKMYGFQPREGVVYQRNRSTGEIKATGSPLVDINQQSEGAFTKQTGEQDAKRLGTIQDNALTVVDTANKVRMATDMLAKTYTGTGGDYANAFFKALQSLGVAGMEGKTDAAAMATAIINDITPKMRVPGTGATSDFEMRTFAAALPSMLNTPGGNDKVAAYWERVAQRATEVQTLAEKYATTEKRLTGTKFAEEVKALGPLFTKDEMAEMQGLSKRKPEVPLDTFNRGSKVNDMIQRQGQQRRPLESFGGPR
jgi:hypothetical protein